MEGIRIHRPVVTVYSILYIVYTDRYYDSMIRRTSEKGYVYTVYLKYGICIMACTFMAANGLEAGLMISMSWYIAALAEAAASEDEEAAGLRRLRGEDQLSQACFR